MSKRVFNVLSDALMPALIMGGMTIALVTDSPEMLLVAATAGIMSALYIVSRTERRLDELERELDSEFGGDE